MIKLKSNEIDFNWKIKHAFGEKKIDYNIDEFAVVCLVKNGSLYIDDFISHYFSLDAKHIFFIDNNSSDDSVSKIKKYSNISIYSTDLSFEYYENEIRNTVIRDICADKWCLCVDIDEFFDYPYSDKISMKQFINYLNKNKYTAVPAYMLDMFSNKADRRDIKENIKNKYCYYDISEIEKEDYFCIYSLPFCCNNILDTEKIKFYHGGIRKSFSKDPSVIFYLNKHPLMLIDSHIEPFTIPHFCNGAYVADVSCLLRHYKLVDSFENDVKNYLSGINTNFFRKKEYNIYHEFLNKKDDFSFFTTKSIKFKNVNELIDENFLSVSKKFFDYVKKNFKK